MIARASSARLPRRQGAQIIVLATPVFLLLVALELAVGIRRGRNTYRWNDALNSIGLGIMSQVTGVFGRLLRIGLHAAVFEHVALWQLDASQAWVWVAGLVAYEYQFWVHTQHVGRLGWFDRWFCSPSNRRVHHAVNDRYLDHNYGGM